MSEDTYRNGLITWNIKRILASEIAGAISPKEWDDGYISFSNTEKRLSDLPDFTASDGRITGMGYLMEVGMWRTRGERYEEIFAEREGVDFLMQEWRLETSEGAEKNCIWRSAATTARPNSIFSGHDLSSIEVIQPENRLHIFITTARRGK